MTKENRPVIDNPRLRDSSSKLIFGDSILCSQFLRDYADMEILRNIQPEDIEDVSERYVPLYSTERESDTVKKVNIGKYLHLKDDENSLKLPLYIVSLVEHKTKVEYNVAMQILRYMIHIWEDYEKDMNKEHPNISTRKDFRYPPIFPIVYYEGTEKWTASHDLADRILCKELLGDYLPHFKYQMIRLHDYSNEELLDKGDEISLAMLINKIRCPEDMEAFTSLPAEQVDLILKDTPEYLLGIIEKQLRALLYSMDLTEERTENAVSRIKERKMGRMFEGVTFSFKTAIEEAAEAAAKAAKSETERELKISRHIARMLAKRSSDEEIKDSLMQEFDLSAEEAEEEYRKTLG